VQKLEELRESGAAPYSDESCFVVLLAHTYMYTTDFITMHAVTYYYGLLGGRTFKK